MTVDVEAARHMRISWRLSATTAEGAASDSVPRLRVLKIGQIAFEIVSETMALSNSLIASFEPVIWDYFSLHDNGSAFSGVNVFRGGTDVGLQLFPNVDEKRP
jgi:hypothetical protein